MRAHFGQRAGVASPSRDQAESAFAPILAELLTWIPGSKAAALVDAEGETVDYAGSMSPYAVRLAAAHWRLVLQQTQHAAQHSERAPPGAAALGGIATLSIRAARQGFLVQALPHGYALVVVLSPAAALGLHLRALSACVRKLAVEAGWAQRPAWYALSVECDDARRPVAICTATGARPCQVLGILASGLGRGERGWRVRCAHAEATLVREPGGIWFADEPLNSTP